MDVTFKLYASLTPYLPPGTAGHETRLQVPPGTTAIDLLQQHGVPAAQVHLVLVNGLFIPPSERANPLDDGDELAVWPAVAGG